MTAIERKQNTEELLKQWNVPVFSELPPIEEESNIHFRTAQEVTERILVLTYLSCVAKEQALQQQIISFLKQEKLWDKASDQEKVLLEKTAFDEDDINMISWHDECIWLLLWAINKVDKLEFPTEEVDVNVLITLLPPFMQSPADYVHTANLRFISEIMDQADLIFRLNWAMHRSELKEPATLPFNQGVAYERYFALNWLMRRREGWEEIE